MKAIKEISISGMSCCHCTARVEKALNSIGGVKAKVDLATATATAVCRTAIDDAVLTEAVEALGFVVNSVKTR